MDLRLRKTRSGLAIRTAPSSCRPLQPRSGTCTAATMDPAPELLFYVNGRKVSAPAGLQWLLPHAPVS